jgi:hypothetical protein
MPAELNPSSPLSDAETRALSHARTFWRPVRLTPTVRLLAALERVLEDDGRGRFGWLGRREYGPAPVENKQALRDMLAQAAANTAKMQGKPER